MNARKSLSLLAVLSTTSWLTLAAVPAQAQPLPTPYAADASADIVSLDANVLPGLLAPRASSSLASVKVGHADTTVDSSKASKNSTADSANLDGQALFGGLPLPIDTQSVSAPPASDPAARVLLPLPLSPLIGLGAVTGDVAANYAADSTSCVPAVNGKRVLSDSITELAATTVLGLPAPIGLNVAQVDASSVHTTTQLVDDGVGGSDVEATSTASIGDISLLGGAAVVKVDNPVSFTAHSDGTTGAVHYPGPATTLATVKLGNNPVIDIHPDGSTTDIPLNLSLLGLSADLKVTAFQPTDTSAGATATADLDAVLRVQLSVNASGALALLLGGTDVASVDLNVSPMHATATAPTGGVQCGVVDTTTDSDGDGLTDTEEGTIGTDPHKADTDGDGLTDGAEVNTYKTDPLKPDTDNGGVNDGTEVMNGTNPLDPSDDVTATNDSDGDGLTDTQEGTLGTDPHKADTDNDGLSDGIEVNTTHTDPLKADTDNGGVNDGTEVHNGTNPLDPSDDVPATNDSDGDGLTDTQEGTIGTDPHKADTDGDGLTDGAEVNTYKTDPLKPDTDGGGIRDGVEVQRGTNPLDPSDDLPATTPTDSDGDGLTDTQEGTIGTDPHNADTDGDGLTDGQEVNTYKTNPLVKDTDGDGLTDGQEVKTYKTKPLVKDTDGDGLTDGQEVKTYKTKPLVKDTDGDGLTDGQEVKTYKTKPLVKDTDGDGLTDGQEVKTYKTKPLVKDTDRDGLTDGQEVKGVRMNLKVKISKHKTITIGVVHTNPLRADTDGDGLKDGIEVKGYHNKKFKKTFRSNPLTKDTDRDGLHDKAEVTGSANKKYRARPTSPTNWDTDHGGVSDKREVRVGSDPTNINSGPHRHM